MIHRAQMHTTATKQGKVPTENAHQWKDGTVWVKGELGEMIRPTSSYPCPHNEETGQHLFLSRNAFLVPLPPGWVMQVAKCLVPSCDS